MTSPRTAAGLSIYQSQMINHEAEDKLLKRLDTITDSADKIIIKTLQLHIFLYTKHNFMAIDLIVEKKFH